MTTYAVYEERFHTKYEIDNATGCWNWTDYKDRGGYGEMKFNGTGWKAHRVSVLLDGRDPEGQCVLHACDNPKCVNPNHLRLGTQKENIDDMVKRDRQTKGSNVHCAKLTEADIPVIRDLLSQGVSQKDIAKQFGVSATTIAHIKLGKRWAHVT
jgi:hypothetical protein